MSEGRKALLAFGEKALTEAVTRTLQKAGFRISTLTEEKTYRIPRERFDCLVQLGCGPRSLTEGTNQLLEKAKADNAKFLLVSSLRILRKPPTACDKTCIESLHFAEAITQEFHRRHGAKTMILRLPTIYGPGIPLNEMGTLGELLAEFTDSQNTNPILTLYGEGKEQNYYLFIEDAAEAIKTAIMIDGAAGSTFHALPLAPISSVAIANLLRKMGGNRHEIYFHKGLVPLEEEIKPAELESRALPKFSAKTPLEDGILQTIKARTGEEHTEERLPLLQRLLKRYDTLRPPVQLTLKRPFLTPRLALKIAAIIIVFSPLLYIGTQAALAAHDLLQLRRQIDAFDLRTAHFSANAAKSHLEAISRFLSEVPFAQKTPLRSLIILSQGGAEAASAVEKVTSEGDVIITALENILISHQGEKPRPQKEEEFLRLASALNKGADHLLTCILHLTQLGHPRNNKITAIMDTLQKGANAFRLGESFAASAPELLGYRGERSYLILLQNSAEARAGGGFLGTLARVTVKDGGIKNLEFFDSYQFDAAGAAAPVTVQKFLNKDALRLRESNFYASFPESGVQVARLFEEVSGEEVDGIIGTNLLFAEGLIKISKPLTLSDFERTVTADNLFEVATEEVEKGFFPGSSKKRRFLQALGEELLNNLFRLEKRDYAKLSKLIWQSLEEKQILLFFKEGRIAQALAESGFDGRVKETGGDFLMVIDSNYGTKANAWIKRSMSYKVFNANRNDQLQGELTVVWEHTGTAAWPAGTYGNLFRALVPKGSKLIKATLDEGECTEKILTTEEAGKTVFALALEVQPQTTSILKLEYILPSTINLQKINRYNLYVQKQPGTSGDSFTFSFERPLGKYITAEKLRMNNNMLSFDGRLDRDLAFTINIERKE